MALSPLAPVPSRAALSFTARAEAAADLVGEALAVQLSGGWILVEWSVRNQGTSVAEGPWTDALYVSPASTCCDGATLLASLAGPPGPPVAAGATYAQSGSAPISSLPLGEYHLILRVNALGTLVETNAANNYLSTPFRIAPQVDLYPSSLSAPASASTGQSISVSWTVGNEPSGPFPEPAVADVWQDNVYISPSATCCAGATFLGSRSHTGGLALNDRYTQALTAVIPDLPAGDYHVILQVDATDAQAEASEHNARAVPIRVTTPDLVPAQLRAPPLASAGQAISVSWNVSNQGTGATVAPWDDSVYLSPTSTCCAAATRLGSWPRTAALAAGAGYSSMRTVAVPRLPAGSYHLLVWANSAGTLHEESHANNRSSIPITITTPDLTPTALTGPAAVATGQAMAVSWTVKNHGTGPAAGTWTDRLYVSPSATCCAGATLLGEWDRSALAAGASYTQSRTITLPALAAGGYHLIVRTDADDVLHEANESDNHRAIPIAVTTPDLAPTALAAPASAVTRQDISVTWTVKNQGIGPTTRTWTDRLYLSPAPTCCAGAIALGQWTWATPVAAGATYTRTKSVTVPAVAAAPYHLVLRADAGDTLGEASENNNDRAIPISVTTPDLVPTAFAAPATAEAGRTISVTWTVRNQGTGVAAGPWADAVYLSAGSTCCAGSTSLGSWARPTPLAAGAGYTQTRTVTLPDLAAGTYHLTVWADAARQLHEASDGNNQRQASVAVASTSVPPPAVLAIAAVNGGIDPVAGTGFAVVVQARDLAGIARNVGTATSVRLGLQSGTGALGGTLTGTIPAGASQVAIGGVTYKKAEGGVVLTASRTAGDPLRSGDSGPFSVQPGAIAGYSVALRSPAAAGAAFGITVTARDRLANAVTSDSSTLVTLRSSSGRVLFDANADGVFGDASGALTAGVLSMSARGTTAEATSVIATDARGKTGSAPLTVTAGAASALAFRRQPGAAPAGGVIPGPPTVAVQDGFGNTITTSSIPITISVGANPGGGTLSGATTRNAASGIASFSDLAISEPGSGYTLIAAAPGLAGAASSPFVVAPIKGAVAGRVARASDGAPLGAVVVDALQATLVKGSSVSGADGAYSMAGLAPGAYDVRASAAGYQPQTRAGVPVTSGGISTADFSLTATPGPVIRITSPAAGSVIDRPVALVRGEIGGFPGADVGVSVNGAPALVGGGQFAALVTLDPGAQTLRAVLTGPGVALAHDAVPVQVAPQPEAARALLAVSPRIGLAPLRVELRVAARFQVAEYQWDVDGDGVVDRAGPSFAEIAVQYATPGLYFARLVVRDAQGAQTTEVAPVLVLDQGALLALLETKWQDLKARLRVGNIGGALGLVALDRQDAFREIFRSLTIPLAQIDQVLTGLRFVQLREGTAEFEMLRTDERGRLSYLVRFALDVDGIWRIKDF